MSGGLLEERLCHYSAEVQVNRYSNGLSPVLHRFFIATNKEFELDYIREYVGVLMDVDNDARARLDEMIRKRTGAKSVGKVNVIGIDRGNPMYIPTDNEMYVEIKK